jgi:hypothetical protein
MLAHPSRLTGPLLAAFRDQDARVGSGAQAVASMPNWSEQRRLDLWEEHCQQVIPDGDQGSFPMGLVVAVIEFSRFNLYGAFDNEKTAEEFRRLITRFAAHGLVLDEHQSVSDR